MFNPPVPYPLLDRSPGDPVEGGGESEKPDVAPSDIVSQQGGSPLFRDGSILCESGRSQPTRPVPAGTSSKSSNNAVQKVKINPSEAAPWQWVGGPQSPPKSGSGDGVLSPKQIGELSRLLSTHRNASDRSSPAMDELFTYLRGVQQNGPGGSEGVAASARRNRDQKLNLEARREEQSNQRRLAANKMVAERNSIPGKPGKKPAPGPQPGSKGAKTAIWR
ncbi:hypothetical protein scyTo_0022739 [Scyliorhinus torazame]|uniref:Uncharacterized protein n=1 Tax=Scyliorhinus torazame TaxID=75743 RepID=A0A401Q6H8_SCYTO|nr:hypothetical protein [Scyliorhinus torazame]